MSAKPTTTKQATPQKELRERLFKILPGYKWTAHNTNGSFLHATGIQSSGFNRLSTIDVQTRPDWYTARISGFGTRSNWAAEGCGTTLAKAIRGMHDALEWKANHYAGLAAAVKSARDGKGDK